MRDKGFTLIEIIAVLLLLGVLAAVALPKYMDLSEDANVVVAKNALGIMKSSVHMIHKKAVLADYPTSIVLNGVTIGLTTDGWPYSSGGTSQGCMDIFNASMDSSQPIAPWTGGIVDEWSALCYLSTCIYVYQNGAVYDGATAPRFQYWHRDHPDPAWGIFAGDFIPVNM